jgi:hypothetical protein
VTICLFVVMFWHMSGTAKARLGGMPSAPLIHDWSRRRASTMFRDYRRLGWYGLHRKPQVNVSR